MSDCAETPVSGNTLCTLALRIRASHGQTPQIKRVVMVNRCFLTSGNTELVFSSVCCLQRKLGVVLEAKFSFREHALCNAVTAASPQLQVCFAGGKD